MALVKKNNNNSVNDNYDNELSSLRRYRKNFTILNVLPYLFNRRQQQKDSVKTRGTESILYKSTLPIIYALRIFGLSPYEFNERQDLVPSNVNMIFSFLWIIMFTYLFHSLSKSLTNFERHDMRLPTVITEFIKATLNYIVVISDIIVALCTRKRMSRIWNRIQDYDETISSMGYARNEGATVIWCWTVFLLHCLIWSLISTLGITGFAESWLKNVSYMIIYVGSAAAVTKFSSITFMLGQRFSQLNKIIQTTINYTVPPWITTNNPTVDCEIIATLHDHLMVTAENLNSIFLWSIFFWMVNMCVHATSSSYYALSWLLDRGSNSSTTIYSNPIYCLCIWTTNFSLHLYMLCYACHYASHEANCMSSIMLESRNSFHKYDRKMEAETSFHLMTRQLRFSAAGFFNVNLPLFTSIISVITTYLCILLQI